jgi:hypothetical protein
MKSKQVILDKHMDSNFSLHKKKHEPKEAKWEYLRLADDMKLVVKEMKERALAEQVEAEAKKAKADARAGDVQFMMMDPLAREF